MHVSVQVIQARFWESLVVLKTLPGVSKPAICGVLPGINKVTRVLDLGANIECSAQDLRSFAIMGSVLSKSAGGILEPTIGLLNIGEEEVKVTIL